MPVGIDEVTIETTTDSKMCAIVSVQNVTVSLYNYQTNNITPAPTSYRSRLDGSIELHANAFREDDVDIRE